MDIKEKMKDFKRRWDLEDDNSVQELNKFKTRILNIFPEIDIYIENEGISQFCQILGIKETWDYRRGDYGFKVYYSKNIINALLGETNEKKLYFLLEIIFSLPFKSSLGKQISGKFISWKEILFEKLKEAIDLSNINLALTKKNDDVILYPKGEKILDDKLVNDALSFLNPESAQHFIDALKSYEQRSPRASIKSAESIRRSLEEFLRFKLQNQKGLEANIKELQSQVNKTNSDKFVRTIIFYSLNTLDSYFNERSKHRDGKIDEVENEFLIYQAGVLMRYINRII